MKKIFYSEKSYFLISTLLFSTFCSKRKNNNSLSFFSEKAINQFINHSFLLVAVTFFIGINNVNAQLLTTSCKVGGLSGATGGDGKVDYNKWNITGLASGNAWYNQTNAATAHLNPATQNIKYGDVVGSTATPTASGTAAVNFTIGVAPFYDDQTSLSVGHFVQIEGYLALPCYSSTLKIRVLANGDPAGVGTVRENYTSLHLSLNSGVPSTDPALLAVVAKDKINFSGSRLDTDPSTTGTQNLEYTFSTVGASGKWIRFANLISNGAQKYGGIIQWSIDGGAYVNVPASSFQSISGAATNTNLSECCCIPTAPVPTATQIANNCPILTFDLSKLQPAAQAGFTYEWHTVPSNPTASTLVSSTAATGTGPFYLYTKNNNGGCYSLASTAVNATLFNCTYNISCAGTQTFREDFGSLRADLPYGVSGAEHPFDSTFCLNGYITNTTVGFSPIGGAQVGTNFTGDVSGDGDTGTHFLYHYTGIGGTICGNAVGDAAWQSTAIINVVAGQKYEYSYYYRKQNSSGSATVIQQQVMPVSGTITTISSTNNAIQNAAWVKNTMIFTASASGPVTLRLNNMLGPVGGNDFGLDNISLTAILDKPNLAVSTGNNTCPSTTADLTSYNPTSPSGLSYEWHTVAINPSASTLVPNPTAVGAGTYYIFAKSGSSCLSTVADTLTITIYSPCKDWDGDGVPDEVDIDDDNDGVPDKTEMNCGLTGAWTGSAGVYEAFIQPDLKVRVTFSGTTWSGITPIANFARSCLDATYASDYEPLSNTNKPGLQFNLNGGSVGATFKVEYLNAANQPVTVNNPRMHLGGLGGSYGTGIIGASDWTLKDGDTQTLLANDVTDFGATSTTIFHPRLFGGGSGVNNCATGEGSGTLQINGPKSSYTYSVDMNGNTFDQMIVVFEGCADMDTDNDGKPNSCDLDSDGDGCADAVEAGNVPSMPSSAWTSTTTSPATSPSTTTSSTYAVALNNTQNLCNSTIACGTTNDAAFTNWTSFGSLANGNIANGVLNTENGPINITYDINNSGNGNGGNSADLSTTNSLYTPPPTTTITGVQANGGQNQSSGTLTFSSPITNPVLHFANMDYVGMRLTGIPPANVIILSGNGNAVISSISGDAFIRSSTSNTTNTGCTGISLCGSVMILGTYNSISYTNPANPIGTSNAVDGHTVTLGLPLVKICCTLDITSNPAPACSGTVLPALIVNETGGTFSVAAPTNGTTVDPNTGVVTLGTNNTASNIISKIYVTKGSCKDSVEVTILPNPTAPINPLASPSTICTGESSTLTATCGAGTLTWYTDAGLTTVITSPVSPVITTTYYGACVNGTCKSPATTITVTIFCENPKITIVKGSSLNLGNDNLATVGDIITYSYDVTNIGNVPLTNVTVTESAANFSGTGTLPTPTFVSANQGSLVGSLKVGEIATYTATYALTAADIAAGKVDNQAVATGKSPKNTNVTDDSDSKNPTDYNETGTPGTNPAEKDKTGTPIAENPKITIVKGSSLNLGNDNLATVGDIITYSYDVTNIGNVPLTNVTVTESAANFSGTGTLPTPTFVSANQGSTVGNLKVGEIATYTATYALTAADIAAGKVDNQAVATGKSPKNATVTDDSDSKNPVDYNETGTPGTNPAEKDKTGTPIAENPKITIVKGSSLNLGADNLATVGDIITYSYDVTNIGNVPLTNITVTESAANFSGTGTLPTPAFVSANQGSTVGSLKVGEKATYTATYALTAADIAAGKVDNQAVATGKSPKNATVTDDSDSKNPTDYNETGTPGTNPAEKDKTGTPIAENPKITIVKGSSLNLGADNLATVGDIITYSYDVTNIGNVPLTNVTVTESAANFSGTGTLPTPTFVSVNQGSTVGNLKVGEIATYTATYALTAADITAGKVDNQAVATGKSPKNATVTDDSDSKNPTDYNETGTPGTNPAEKDKTGTPIAENPKITIVKGSSLNLGADNLATVGDIITYSYDVTNIGNVPLTNVTVTESVANFSGTGILPTPTFVSANQGSTVGSLKVGEIATYTATYALTAADITAGKVDNQAVTAGVSPKNTSVTDDSDSKNPTDYNETGTPGTNPSEKDKTGTPIAENPKITIVKGSSLNLGADNLATVGDIITYSYDVTNIGNVPLTNVTVTESAANFSGAGTLPTPTFVSANQGSLVGSLKVGEIATYTATYALTAADITAGKVDNQAVTAGVSPKNTSVTDDSDSKNPTDYNETGTPGTNPSEKDKTGTPIAQPVVDIEVKKYASTATPDLNQNFTYKVVVKNNGPNNATNVVIEEVFPAGITYISGSSTKGVWSNPTLSIPSLIVGDSAVLTITASAYVNGISTNRVYVKSVDQYDTKLTNNIASVCTSVPVLICQGQSVELSVGSNNTGVTWYKNGQAIGQGNTIIASTDGEYLPRTATNTCPNGNCCPIIVKTEVCCEAICIPISTRKIK